MHCHAARVFEWLSKVRLMITTSGRRAEVPVQMVQDAPLADNKAGDKPAAADGQKAKQEAEEAAPKMPAKPTLLLRGRREPGVV